MADIPGGARGMLARSYKGKKADRLVMDGVMGWRLNAVVCSRVRELQETISAGTIALEISSRNSRVAALQKRWDRLRAGLDLILDQWGAGMADIPGGASGSLVRGYKGKEADRLVTRIDPGVVSLVADLRGHERKAAEELGRRNTVAEERKVIDASQVAITCRKPSTGCAPWGAYPSSPRQWRGRRPATADGWRGRLESDPRRGKGSFPRHHRPRDQRPQLPRRSPPNAGTGCAPALDLILDQRCAGMADLPGGASGILRRDYKGKEAAW
jgi:hypothetical protein